MPLDPVLTLTHYGLGVPQSSRNTKEETMEARIERLESLVALQDQTIEKLSDEIYEQQRQLADLARQVERLAGKLREMDDVLGQAGGTDAPPPHYNG